jgi:ribulose 1,5-bisphosphate synthetase/thiazole synthase
MANALRRDISAPKSFTNGSTKTDAEHLECDVLIVGAGFGGIYLLHRLRDEFGLNCKIYEAGTNLGMPP